MVCGHEVIEVAHRKQALGEGVGSAHGWLVCLLNGVVSIVLSGRQLRSDGGEYFSSLLRGLVFNMRHSVAHFRIKPMPSEGEVQAFKFTNDRGLDAEIPIAELREFVQRLSAHLKEQ